VFIATRRKESIGVLRQYAGFLRLRAGIDLNE
jgi:hypothetical protein